MVGLGNVPEAGFFTLGTFYKGLCKPEGLGEGFYPCRGEFEGKITCSRGGMGGKGSPKWPGALWSLLKINGYYA